MVHTSAFSHTMYVSALHLHMAVVNCASSATGCPEIGRSSRNSVCPTMIRISVLASPVGVSLSRQEREINLAPTFFFSFFSLSVPACDLIRSAHRKTTEIYVRTHLGSRAFVCRVCVRMSKDDKEDSRRTNKDFAFATATHQKV